MSSKEVIEIDLGDYYEGAATIEIGKNSDGYYMRLGWRGGENEVKISKEFFEACIKEFGNG
jgi:hypothetical protein